MFRQQMSNKQTNCDYLNNSYHLIIYYKFVYVKKCIFVCLFKNKECCNSLAYLHMRCVLRRLVHNLPARLPDKAHCVVPGPQLCLEGLVTFKEPGHCVKVAMYGGVL